MDQDDPEKRIAELERELAAQQRIAELKRQLAEAKAAAGQPVEPPPQFSDRQEFAGQDAGDERARRYAQSLWEGLQTGAPPGPDGPSGADMTQLRDAFTRAAAQAGMSQAQLNNALQHGSVTIKTGHSVVYPGQGIPKDFGAPAGMGSPTVFPAATGFRRQTQFAGPPPRRKLVGANRFGTIVGWIGGAIGLCVGGAAVLTATLPSSASWTSAIVCGGPNQLMVNTAHYSYKPGQSGTNIDFQCLSADGAHDANFFAISTLQTLVVALVLGGAVAVGLLIRRVLRGQPLRRSNVIIAGALGLLAVGVVVAVASQTLSAGATQMPQGGELTIDGNAETKTIACNDGHLTVTGRAETVTVTGHCGRVSVDGVINHVTVDSVDAIDVDGVNNVVTYHSGSPQITKSGAQNTVQQG